MNNLIFIHRYTSVINLNIRLINIYFNRLKYLLKTTFQCRRFAVVRTTDTDYKIMQYLYFSNSYVVIIVTIIYYFI